MFLFLFTIHYSLFTLYYSLNYTDAVKKLLPWILAAAAGTAMALAFPGAGWSPLILLAPGLLLEAIERTESGWRPWIMGWFAGIVHWVIAVNWVLPVMHHYGGLPWFAALGSLIGMGVILGAFWAAALGLTSLVPSRVRMWLLPCAFVGMDVLRRWWPIEFPWHPPAVALVSTPALLGSLPVWGATGLGWAVLTLGSGLWAMRFSSGRRLGLAACCLSLALAIVFTIVAPPFAPSGDTVAVGLIQPGTSLEEKWNPDQWQGMEARVWQLTRATAAAGAEVVLWPESALPYRVDSDPAYAAMLTTLARVEDIRIVVNSVAGSADQGFTNSAFVVGPEGVDSTRYDKMRLVPFGEYVPSWARFAFTDALVREVGNFTPGRDPLLLDVGAPLGMAVCYEVVFPGLATREVRDGAEFLVTLTNDGWYGYSWAPRQHFAHVVLRAVENRRWLVRAALTGISGFVAPDGRVSQQLDVGETGYLVADLPFSTSLTPRSRWGDWWAVVCWLATAVLIVVGRATADRTRNFLLS